MLRVLLGSVLLLSVTVDAAGETPAVGRVARLDRVKSWGYQLQRIKPVEIAASAHDLVVIDYSRNGSHAARFTRDEVKAMQIKPDGGRRLVLAYMSIGEAEDYRFYWNRNWTEPAPYRSPNGATATLPSEPRPETVRIPRLIAPGWLGRENQHWKGNYHVRFWYDGWQELIMHNPDSYLSRVIEAGFDGVYLDRVDVYYALDRDAVGAKYWMINFVSELAEIARRRKPGFIVVAQNAEELLEEPRYVAAIDGVAKEDLLFGIDGDGVRNGEVRVGEALGHLVKAQRVGVGVLVVEYMNDIAQMREAAATLRSRGFIPYFAARGLDALSPPPPAAAPATDDPGGGAAPKPAAPTARP